MRLNDTIAAVSTPPGRGGIGIVRISGRDARAISERMLRLPPEHGWRAWTATLAELPDSEGHAVDHVIATFFAGALVLGIQSGINVVGAMIYPTSLRANGSGWQLGIGRLGAIVGPLLGALFVGLPLEQLYMWSALPFAGGAVVTFLIYVLNKERLRAHPANRSRRPGGISRR